jgi:pyruvate dehydrogenase E1 component beta subunit
VQEGNDVTIVSYSRVMNEAVTAAKALEADGISAELIDLRTIAPWDRATVLASVTKTGRLVVAHEAVKPFGVGAEIAADIGNALFGRLKAPIERIGANFSPVPFSKPLETAFLPSADAIAETVRKLVKG